jgi:hypothetical protein
LSIPQSKLKHAVISTKDIKVNKAIIMNFVYQKFIDCGNVYRKETKKKTKEKHTHNLPLWKMAITKHMF